MLYGKGTHVQSFISTYSVFIIAYDYTIDITDVN